MKKKETQFEINMDSIKVEFQNNSTRITTDDYQIICEPTSDKEHLIFQLNDMNKNNSNSPVVFAVEPMKNEIFIAKKLFEVLMIAYAEAQKPKPKESPLH